MADIRGIELASEIYGLEDTSARNTATAASQTATQAGQTATQASQTATQASQTATQASQTATQADSKIGTLANLQTTVKTDLVSAINETLTSKTLPYTTLTPSQGVTADILALANLSRDGNVISGLLYIDNINGANVGTPNAQIITTTTLRPKEVTCFMGYDFRNGATIWGQWGTDGIIKLSLLSNVTKGSNSIRAQFTIIV